MSNNYLFNTRQKANQAIRKPPHQRAQALSNEMYPALVTAVNADGSYDVRTVDVSGGSGEHFHTVMAHPQDSTFESGAEVWIWQPSNGDAPLIMSGGGGASASCSMAPDDWGTFYG